jgi:hypothetical protein
VVGLRSAAAAGGLALSSGRLTPRRVGEDAGGGGGDAGAGDAEGGGGGGGGGAAFFMANDFDLGGGGGTDVVFGPAPAPPDPDPDPDPPRGGRADLSCGSGLGSGGAVVTFGAGWATGGGSALAKPDRL